MASQRVVCAAQMRYAVCEPTLMKTYEGRWSLTPLPPAGLPAQRHHPRGRQQRDQGSQLRSEGLNNWSQQCWHQLSGVNSSAPPQLRPVHPQ
jgi:hypothetical protein